MKLKEIRQSSGKTQDDVAHYLNIARASYTNIENGKRNPDIQTLILLADYFSVSIDSIVGREEKERAIPCPLPYEGLITLSDTELHLITDYRSLSSQGQEYIRQQMYMAKSIYTAGDTGFAGMETAVE